MRKLKLLVNVRYVLCCCTKLKKKKKDEFIMRGGVTGLWSTVV